MAYKTVNQFTIYFNKYNKYGKIDKRIKIWL